MDEWLLYFSLIAPYTPTPRVQQIGNYTLAYLTSLHKKYKRTKHILLLISLPEVAVCFFIIFFTAVIWTYIYIHIIQFHLYHTVNIYSNWLQEQFCNLSLHTLYTLCAINLCKK